MCGKLGIGSPLKRLPNVTKGTKNEGFFKGLFIADISKFLQK